jgi:ABC-2 type transport system ATP-binding protein
VRAGVPERVREVEKTCALQDVDGEVIASLSHGFRQRVGLAQALIHRPKLIILDEPTTGLDPRQTVEMRAMIRALKGDHTVLVSSHILSEISQLCDRLLVIHEGEIVAQGTEEELARSLGSSGTVEAEVASPGDRALELLRGVPGVRGAQLLCERDGWASLRVEAPGDLRPALVKALVSAGIDLRRIDAGQSRLESIFLRATQAKEAA